MIVQSFHMLRNHLMEGILRNANLCIDKIKLLVAKIAKITLHGITNYVYMDGIIILQLQADIYFQLASH